MANVRSHSDALLAGLRDAGVQEAVAITPTEERGVFLVQKVAIRPDGDVVPLEEPKTMRGSDIYLLYVRHESALLFLYVSLKGTAREWISVNPDLTHREVKGRVIRVPFNQTI